MNKAIIDETYVNKMQVDNTIDINYLKKCIAEKDLEILDLNDYIINISKHHIVPHHEIVKDAKEIQDVCSQYNVTDKTLFPLITINDPMAKFMNAKQGDLIRITRKSINLGETIVYRFCI